MSQSMSRKTTTPDTMVARYADLRIDGARLLGFLEELGQIGADPAGGVTRLGLSPAEREARSYLGDVCADAGLVSEVDPAGNFFARRPHARPDTPAMLIGSHVDTVVNGGRLDGAYGVTAGIEALRTLNAHSVELRHEPVVVAFANEEGALVQYPFWGSRALAGQLGDGTAAEDRSGRSVRDHLVVAGGDPEGLDAAVWPPDSIAAYLELHIEQGPVLERREVPIGVVDGIVGRTILEVCVAGRAQHAGTTPMADRQDALVAAAELVLGFRRIAAVRKLCSTATVGFLDAAPNVTNTIAGLVRLTVEVRDADPVRIQHAEAAVRAECKRVARATGVHIVPTVASRSQPVSTAPTLRNVIARSATGLGLRHLTLPSGAGHDAQIVAGVAPIGMIFVPSRDGVSHAPDEDTAPEALIRGADVLLHVILGTDDALARGGRLR